MRRILRHRHQSRNYSHYCYFFCRGFQEVIKPVQDENFLIHCLILFWLQEELSFRKFGFLIVSVFVYNLQRVEYIIYKRFLPSVSFFSFTVTMKKRDENIPIINETIAIVLNWIKAELKKLLVWRNYAIFYSRNWKTMRATIKTRKFAT